MALLAPPGLPVGTFEIKSQDSRVEFFMKDNRGGFPGTTRDVSGTVTIRERGESGYTAEVEAKVDARTIKTGSSLRDGQMRSARFLNTEEFPFITFRGTVSAENPPGPQFKGTLRGWLTIRDVTRDVQVPLEIAVESGAFTARGEGVVRMTDFSIPIPRFLIFVAEDPVTVKLQIRLIPKG
jgi:polyisoprenoid-binding protein YceI